MKGAESQEQTVAVPKQLIFSLAREYKRFLGCGTGFNYSQVSLDNLY